MRSPKATGSFYRVIAIGSQVIFDSFGFCPEIFALRPVFSISGRSTPQTYAATKAYVVTDLRIAICSR
ncbi:hypothetical protein S7335_5590 [Synechococcus sp. PCC 7335]|nr:hypothetical protein S7335_5590 [Synechococcus sp. PCC 7335]